MKNKKMTFYEIIQWRIRVLWAAIACMLVYMVVITCLGGGDSRIMTPLANFVSDVILFGGMIFAGCRIRFNRKLLSSKARLKQKQMDEQDERNQYLHDKSGGIVVDILLAALLFTTVTAALFNMAAFYLSLTVLLLTLGLKAVVYWAYASGRDR